MPFRLISIFLLLSAICFGQEFDGYTLYNQLGSKTTYLIDKNENIAHTWSLPTECNYAVLLKENGNIIRGGINNFNQIDGAAVGGLIEEYDPYGNLVWKFQYSDNNVVAHHDISRMPNDNVLMIAWEVVDGNTVEAMGYEGNVTELYAMHLIEVSQIEGTQNGEIVWEWHIIDHLVQNTDPNKPNYGQIDEHPELLDINVDVGGFGGGFGGWGGDWFHFNGVDYNEELDLIVMSSRFLSEIFIIDHSTTVEEAAGHTGGNFGKGGDFLYRYGKPSNYHTAGPQAIPGPVHDSRWIPDDGRPRGGMIQFVNNDGNGFQSTVDVIELPWNADKTGFIKEEGQAFSPSSPDWRHTCFSNAWGQSAANSLPNGNLFVALSGGYMYEVDQNNNTVWSYPEGPAKAFRYICTYPGIEVLSDEGVIEDLCMTVSTDDEFQPKLVLYPNPASTSITIEGIEAREIQSIQVSDISGKVLSTSFGTSSIDLSEMNNGLYYISIITKSGSALTQTLTLIH